MPEPTRKQICAYLQVTGWDVYAVGAVKTQWIRSGQSVYMRHGTARPDLDEAIIKIASAEGRHSADTRDDILDVDNPLHARIRAFAVSSMCERAAEIVRGRLDEARDDGWPGVWNARLADTMAEQASALVKVLEKTAASIKAAVEADTPAPWHPLWTAAGRAAETILLAEPVTPDDMDALQARLDAMRVARNDGSP